MIFYSILALAAFLLSLLGTRALIVASRHKAFPADLAILRYGPPAPRSGGLVVVTALVICLLAAGMEYPLVLSLLILVAVSLLGDVIRLPFWVSALVQVIAVAIVLSDLPELFAGLLLPEWLLKTVLGVLWLFFMQTFRAMDGIDGLSATEMIGVTMGLCWITVLMGDFPDILTTYSMIAACVGAGFLWWSWYPAKVFMGRTGTIPVGFFLGYLLIMAFSQGYYFAAMILPAYHFLDTGITWVRRLFRREIFSRSRLGFYYQRALENGHSHDWVVRRIFGVNLLLTMVASFATLDPEFAIFHMANGYMAVCMILGFFAHTRQKEAPLNI